MKFEKTETSSSRWKSNDNNNINTFLSLENPCTFLLPQEKTWKHNFNTNSELSQNCIEQQIMPSKTTVNWLLYNLFYLFIPCFDWKISIFQQTVVRVYYFLKSCKISGQIFGLNSSFLSNRQLQVVLDRKFPQEYPVNARVPQDSILAPTLFLLYINDLPDDVICNFAIYDDDTNIYSKCDQASDLWPQLELASELESDLQDTVDWAGSGLLILMLGKLN